jgi:hypothetical protein
MSEITLKAIEQLLDQKLGGLVTKDDAATTEGRIIKRIEESQEDLARIVADTIATPFTKRLDRIEELLKVKDDVENLKRQMEELRLHLSV